MMQLILAGDRAGDDAWNTTDIDDKDAETDSRYPNIG